TSFSRDWSSDVCSSDLLERGLVDELVLMTYPVVLGTGKKLFGDGAEAAAFTLTDSVVTPDGVFLARYARSGEVRTGTVGASDTPDRKSVGAGKSGAHAS